MCDQPLSVREPRVPGRFVQGGGMPTSLPRLGQVRREYGNANHPQGLRLGEAHYYLRGRHWTAEVPAVAVVGVHRVVRDDLTGYADYWRDGEPLAAVLDRVEAYVRMDAAA